MHDVRPAPGFNADLGYLPVTWESDRKKSCVTFGRLIAVIFAKMELFFVPLKAQLANG